MNTYDYFVSYSWAHNGMGGFGNLTLTAETDADPMSREAFEALIAEVGRTARTPYGTGAGVIVLNVILLSS